MKIQSPPQRIRALQRKIWLESSVYRPLIVSAMVVAAVCGFMAGYVLVTDFAAHYEAPSGVYELLALISSVLGASFVLSSSVWEKWLARSRYRQEWSVQELSVYSGTTSEAEFAEWRASRRLSAG